MLHKPLRIAVNAAQHRRPGPLNGQIAAAARADRIARLIQNRGVNAGKGLRGRAGLEGSYPRQGANQDGAGFGLPPGIHDRAAAAADMLPVPDPRLRVNRLAHRTQQAQGGHIVALGIFLAPAHKGADGRGRGVKDGAAILGDDGPEPIPVGIIRRTLVHHRSGPVRQRPIDNVAVAGDPANIGGTPIDIRLFQVENPLGSGIDAGQIAAGGVDDALGLAGSAAGVEHIEHILAVHRLRSAGQRLAGHQVVPPHIPPGGHPLRGLAGAADDHHLFHRGSALQGGVGVLFQRHNAAAAIAPVGGNQHLGLGILQAVADGFGAEPAKDDAVRRADPGAGQHRNRQFRDHRQINRYPVALFYPQAFQPVGKAADLPIQVPIGIDLPIPRLPFPDDGGLVAAGRVQMPVDAVVSGVEPAAAEPLGIGRLPIQDLIPGLEPVQFGGKGGPESLRIGGGPGIDLRVVDIGLPGELRRRGKGAIFL